jgi:iron(III) transport system permease protein
MTMPVRIYLLILDGDFGTAAALSSILLVLSGTAVYIAFRFLGRNEQALL